MKLFHFQIIIAKKKLAYYSNKISGDNLWVGEGGVIGWVVL